MAKKKKGNFKVKKGARATKAQKKAMRGFNADMSRTSGISQG